VRIRRLLVAAIAPLILLGASAPNGTIASLREAATAYNANLKAIAATTSRDTTMDYYQRLVDDQDLFSNEPTPDGYSDDAWKVTTQSIADLDVSLANQLITHAYRPMASIRGLGETLVRSSVDGTMQPVAVYVPSTYVPGKAAALIVFLHGNPQSETALLAPAYVRQLAEANGTILIAPYGRGYYDFRGSTSDVYDAFDAAMQAFTTDPRKHFLVGYSMGGFSVFEVAPVRANAWAAVMCISGGLLGTDAPKVVAFMRNTPFYVLTGSKDQSIPTIYPTIAAEYLGSQGIPVSFYSLPAGFHRLISLTPILGLAWADMLHQIVRAPPPAFGGGQLPTTAPMAGLKT
jgi:predicted esterase